MFDRARILGRLSRENEESTGGEQGLQREKRASSLISITFQTPRGKARREKRMEKKLLRKKRRGGGKKEAANNLARWAQDLLERSKPCTSFIN